MNTNSTETILRPDMCFLEWSTNTISCLIFCCFISGVPCEYLYLILQHFCFCCWNYWSWIKLNKGHDDQSKWYLHRHKCEQLLMPTANQTCWLAMHSPFVHNRMQTQANRHTEQTRDNAKVLQRQFYFVE